MARKSLSPEKITTSSTAEYFSKNLQQVGFSSQTKAVLTTLKEAVDNALDACEEVGVLPEVWVDVKKEGEGAVKNADRIVVKVTDNGPGINPDDVPKVFGEYLASSKFGRGRCSRGQQGIGISAATTWAQLTSATGAKVITKTKNMRKAFFSMVEVDIKNNKGVLKDKKTIDWDQPHGTEVEFQIDGRIQLNGEGGLLSYLSGSVLVNPHLTLHYKLPEMEKGEDVPRVSNEVPSIPPATEPHPHTMKLGEFIAHSHLFGKTKTSAWLKKGFSRVSDTVVSDIKKSLGKAGSLLDKSVDALDDEGFKQLFTALTKMELRAPSTQSVMSVGEESLAKSINRLGEVDFFAVVSRRPAICDFKPVLVEVAISRLKSNVGDPESSVSVLRFANRVPLQFDKSACAIVKAVTTVNWKAYGIQQPKDALPLGPYIIAVSVVSPFIKFKNASKETIDASDELVEEIRRALMQAGQRLSRHIRREFKANALEEKIKHIEQFGPILVETLCRITGASKARKKKAEEGLLKLLGRDAQSAEKDFKEADTKLEEHLSDEKKRIGDLAAPEGGTEGNGEDEATDEESDREASEAGEERESQDDAAPAKDFKKSKNHKKAKGPGRDGDKRKSRLKKEKEVNPAEEKVAKLEKTLKAKQSEGSKAQKPPKPEKAKPGKSKSSKKKSKE